MYIRIYFFIGYIFTSLTLNRKKIQHLQERNIE